MVVPAVPRIVLRLDSRLDVYCIANVVTKAYLKSRQCLNCAVDGLPSGPPTFMRLYRSLAKPSAGAV